MRFMSILPLSIVAVTAFSQEYVASTTSNLKSMEINSSPTFEKKYEYPVLSYRDEMNAITADVAGKHFLGSEISRQLYLFNEYYTYKVPLSPGNPSTKTMIRKPLIYSTVRKIERGLKKDLAKNRITDTTAREEFSKVLEVAICIVDLNTDELEKEIKNTDDVKDLIMLLTRRVTLEYIN